MADPSSYRPKPGQIPDSPGVYRFRDDHRRVIYVGKAKSLRQRLSSYFQDLAGLHPRTRTMVTTASSVEWTVVSTEVEALQLEYTWIKEFDPRFNVKYRDDKSYPYLAVTMNEEFPRVQVMRGQKKKGVRYFGPYGHAWAIRDTVDLLLRVFPVRTCSAGVFKNAARTGRPCLLGYIGKCAAPCVGRISPEDHRDLAEEFCDFMAGRTGAYLRRLERQMQEAAEEMEYERAGRLRDDIEALRRAMEKSAVVLADATDADLIAVAEDELEAAVQIFHVRGGRVRGQRGWVTDKVEAVDTAGLVGHALQQLYGEERGEGVPKEVLVPALPENTEAVSQWLGDRRGTQVSLRIPQRGDKKSLMETVQRNAQQSLVLHKTRRASDLTTRSRALEEIAEALELESAPLRIECYDISHFQGDDVVASMVVFEDGLARKSEYRRFQIKGRAGDTQLWHGQGQDDVRSMHEVITRRFRRYLSDRERTGEWTEEQDATEGGEVTASLTDEDGRPKRFAYPPQLVVVDGGQPQVAAAQRALDELGIDDIAVCGLAKRLEEVWVPGQDDPVVLPRTSEGLYLLQRIRDEAHRFAITYQRAKRSKRIRTSPLDDVPGLGETRKQALVKHFGSVRKLRAATVEQICEVPGIGRKTALAVAATLAQSAPSVAVNTATGEIVGDDDTDESPENGEAPATGESDGPGAGGGTVPSTPESRGADRPASGSEGEQGSPADGSAQGDGPSAEPVKGEPAGSGEAEPGAEGPGGPLAADLPQDEPAPQETAPAPPALGLPQDGPRSHGDALPLVHPAPSAPQPGDARTARVPGEGDAAPIQGVAPQPAQGEAAPGGGVAAGPGGNSPGPHRAAGSPDGGAAGQTGDPEVSGPAEKERPGDRTAPDGGPDQAPPQTAPKNRGQQT
ncbi:excinuclease ABC subunit UvrC [Streptomyces albidoflavus]|nr:excinuclease ABC subunit UvrC [Streptomyces albidoflavus]MCX4467384.1 excinuclease ABC subunit UvrC [Streptomyces albidoflavus]MYX51188.1 excinuclease ABC subunit UvrC [Streptomyces sp. SID8385]WSI91309.1 excinuclease ABC subunit UvrC [Streptomyces albidoflavus]CAI4155324.1 excinuclease ABC subunit UvrC [Streptomyces albidoflavus]